MTIFLDKPEAETNPDTPTPLPIPRGQPRKIGRAQRALAGLAAAAGAVCGPRSEEGFGILMYHRVVDCPPGYPAPTWNVPPKRFAQQLAGLLRRGWKPCSLRGALELHRQGKPIPAKVFVVTFDDGYANNLLHALPVLLALNIPATIFLATAYLDSDQPFPSDDWPLAGDHRVPPDTWKPLTTPQCRELLESGLIELGAHTHTHADFRGRPHELFLDLVNCSYILQDRFGVEDPTFAFPYGTRADGFSGGALAVAARNSGVQCSLSTEPRLIQTGDDPYDWGRFAAEEHDTAATLAGKLGGWHTLFRALGKSVLRRK